METKATIDGIKSRRASLYLQLYQYLAGTPIVTKQWSPLAALPVSPRLNCTADSTQHASTPPPLPASLMLHTEVYRGKKNTTKPTSFVFPAKVRYWFSFPLRS